MDEIKNLDDILSCLVKEPRFRLGMNDGDIKNLLNENSIDDTNMFPVLNKLKKDELIEVYQLTATYSNQTIYRMALEGIIFERNGGYKTKATLIVYDEERIRKLETSQIQLTRLTFWVALGTVGLLLIETVKFFVDHNFYLCH